MISRITLIFHQMMDIFFTKNVHFLRLTISLIFVFANDSVTKSSHIIPSYTHGPTHTHTYTPIHTHTQIYMCVCVLLSSIVQVRWWDFTRLFLPDRPWGVLRSPVIMLWLFIDCLHLSHSKGTGQLQWRAVKPFKKSMPQKSINHLHSPFSLFRVKGLI